MSVDAVHAASVSEAWHGACAALLRLPEPSANHLFIRMAAPLPEDPRIRADADAFVASVRRQEINEVRNTIFPAELATDFPEPADLAKAYLEDYSFLRAVGAGSSGGTYFGRIYSFPRDGDGTGRQLENTVKKLRAARDAQRLTSRYELNMYSEQRDGNKRYGFPCMTHLAFHLSGDHLDCLAIYRNHDVIGKGYGNYLGLAGLQAYVARASGFRPGELAVVAGHAYFDLNKTARRRLEDLVTAHRC